MEDLEGSGEEFEQSVTESTPLLTDSANLDLRNNKKITEDIEGSFTISSLQQAAKWNKQQKSLIISLSILQFFAYCCLSILAPFFPYEAAQKGMSNTTAGFVFSCFSMTQVIVSPIAGKFFVPIAGPRFVILAGSLFAGSCSILFGILDEIDNEFHFTLMVFIVRIFEAVGIACYSTAAFAFIINLFPGSVGVVLGITEISVGVGLTMGPAIGAGAYTLGGYKLPFLVLGSLLLLTVPLNFIILPLDPENNVVKKPALMPMLTHFYPLLCLYVIVTLCTSTSFIDPTLQPHLADIGLGPAETGLMFIVTTATYSILTPFVGRFSDKHVEARPFLVCVGLLLIGLAYLVMGPSPILQGIFSNSVASNIIGLIVYGLGVGAMFVPSFQIVLGAALEIGYEDSLPTHSAVSGLYNTAFCLGAVVGPSIGGSLLDYVGYAMASSIVAYISFVTCLVFLVTSVYRYLKSRH